MSFKVRKAERPAIEAVLQNEGDMDEIVAAVFATVADLMMARDWYTLVVNDPPVVYLFGPYESAATATREAKKLTSTRKDRPLEAMVRQLYKVQETL
jgi:hypothetical protein